MVPHWLINNENISVKEKDLKFKIFEIISTKGSCPPHLTLLNGSIYALCQPPNRRPWGLLFVSHGFDIYLEHSDLELHLDLEYPAKRIHIVLSIKDFLCLSTREVPRNTARLLSKYGLESE